MLTILFMVTTVVCGIGWLSYWIGSAALAKYMLDQGYAPPSDEELKKCSNWVIRRMLKLKD